MKYKKHFVVCQIYNAIPDKDEAGNPESENKADDQKNIDQLHEYRTQLVEEDLKSQEDIDKTVLTLSGGALGISFVFLRDVVGDNPIIYLGFLFGAWIAWVLSLIVMLVSFYLSHQAFRSAINQVDTGKLDEPIGGLYTRLTDIATIIGGVLFISGVILIVIFARYNLR